MDQNNDVVILEKKPVKMTAAALKRAKTKRRTELLTKRRDEFEEEFTTVEERIKTISYPKVKGLSVLHGKFGTGKIVDQKENHISVTFKSDKKDFQLPDAIAKDYLKVENGKIISAYKELSELLLRKKTISRSLLVLVRELEPIEE